LRISDIWPECPADQLISSVACAYNSVIYLVAAYQLCFVGLVFTSGKPFRVPVYKNYYFMIWLAIYIAFTLLMNFNPFNWSIINDADFGATHGLDA